MKFKNQIIIAHRGARGLVEHENTITAFAKAIELGAFGIELDVRKTKDNKIIVFHDGTVSDRLVKDLTYEELLSLKQYEIPTLEEVMIYCKGKILLDIELKETGYEQELVDLVLKHLSLDEFYMRSFYDESIRKIKTINPDVITGLIVGTDKPKYGFISRLNEIFPILRIIYSKCDFISPYYRLVILGYTKRMHFWNKPVLVWTVNEKSLIKKLLFKNKVDGVLTDYPDRGLEVLKNVE